MRYFYEKPERFRSSYGNTYQCNHPVYDPCTLFKIGKNGLSVIQQRYHKDSEYTYWTEIDPWLTDELYLHPKFKSFFDERSGEPEGNLYPTVTIRQLMRGIEDETDTTRTMGDLL